MNSLALEQPLERGTLRQRQDAVDGQQEQSDGLSALSADGFGYLSMERQIR